VEANVDGADDALDRGLDGVDAGAERAGVVLGEAVQHREAHRGLRRRHPDEVEVPQLRGPLRRHLILHHHLPLLKRKRTPTQIQISTNQIGANSALAGVESRGGERRRDFALPLGAGGWAPPSHGIGREGAFSRTLARTTRRFFPLPAAALMKRGDGTKEYIGGVRCSQPSDAGARFDRSRQGDARTLWSRTAASGLP
jgi:hypothetical protein